MQKSGMTALLSIFCVFIVNACATSKAKPKSFDPSQAGGVLDKKEIEDVINADLTAIKECYETFLAVVVSKSNRSLSKFVIGGDGSVQSSSTKLETSPETEAMEKCIDKAIAGWKFPNPRGGGNVEVTYQFVFNPRSAE